MLDKEERFMVEQNILLIFDFFRNLVMSHSTHKKTFGFLIIQRHYVVVNLQQVKN